MFLEYRPAVTTTSAHPREVLQRDADVDLSRRKSRRAVSPCKPDTPRKPDTPAIPVSLFVPKVDIYDGCPPILPVRLQLSDSLSDAISSEEDSDASVATSESSAHVFTPLGGRVYSSASRPASSNNIRRANSVLIMDFEPVIMSEFSRDAEPDLLDALHQVQLLFCLSYRWSCRRVNRHRLFPLYLRQSLRCGLLE